MDKRFTLEGLPIVEEDFKNSFFFDLEMKMLIYPKKEPIEVINKWAKEIEKENPNYARCLSALYKIASEDFPEYSNMILGFNIISYIILREQGREYMHNFNLPIIKMKTIEKINKKARKSKIDFYLQINEEVNKENPLYVPSMKKFIREYISNMYIVGSIEGFITHNYKFLKEQAKKDGLAERLGII